MFVTEKGKMVRPNRLKLTRDSFAMIVGVALVLLTILLIIDLQSGLNFSNEFVEFPDLKTIGESEHTNYITEEGDVPQQNGKFRMENIRDFFISTDPSSENAEILRMRLQPKDQFNDIHVASEYIAKENSKRHRVEPEFLSMSELVEYNASDLNILDKFNLEMKQNEMYPADSKLVDELLHEMSTGKLVAVGQKDGGTQIKMTMEYENGMFALVKPMRYPRDQQALPNLGYYADFERHHSEIAAFHLDRLMGFRRAMPVTGRSLNVITEIHDLAEEDFQKTFFQSPQPDSNQCFYGLCRRYCDVYHPICSINGTVEAAFVAFYPINFNVEVRSKKNPWKRSYSVSRKAEWEIDPNYCERVKLDEYYAKGRRLLDVIDMAIFDFITGNMDRHHYGYFDVLGSDSFIVHYDNGRGFGQAFHDEISNLMPLIQCCMIRQSTLETLLRFHNGPKPLSQLMKESLASDPTAPILWEPYFDAIDRRVAIILEKTRECLQKKPPNDVIYPGYNIEDKI